jgi:hypothetical protein
MWAGHQLQNIQSCKTLNFIYMINFIFLFIMLLIVSSIFINGWFAITRGRWEVKADGSKVWVGKIFNFWHKFLQQHTMEVEYYIGDEFMKQFCKIRDYFKDDEVVKFFNTAVVVKTMNEKKVAFLFSYAALKGVQLSVGDYKESNNNEMIISIYKEVPKYKYPYWITDPLGLCITCLSSVYGTLIWIFWVMLAKDINALYCTKTIAMFIALSFWYKAALWVIFCMSLAYLNDLFLNIKNHFGK